VQISTRAPTRRSAAPCPVRSADFNLVLAALHIVA
jgi:hypothetical protein